jgi:L-cystine transport system substrate-binding protein
MRKNSTVQKIVAGLLTVVIAGTLAACGSSSTGATSSSAVSASGTSSSAASGSSTGSVTTIPVGVCSTAKPDAYIDDSGNLTGFDIETLRAIDNLLPQYQFDLQTMEFPEILNSLSTGKVLMGSQEFEWNKERQEKYLFGTVPLVSYETYIVTLKDSKYDSVTGFKDLGGKTTLAPQGGSTEAQINTWNAAHPEAQIKTVSSASSLEEWVSDLNNGVVDFLITTEAGYKSFSDSYDTSNWELHKNAKVYDSNSFVLFGKTQSELQKAVDGALQELTDNGTLSQLSIKFYGKDYTAKAKTTDTSSSSTSSSTSASN